MMLTPKPENWPRAKINPGKNARTIAVDDGIRELLQSIQANGLLQPLGVVDRAEDNLIFGFRRYAALCLGKIESVRVSVYPADITPTQREVINLTENLQRLDLSDPEIFRACSAMMQLNPNWQRKDLAAHLGKDPSVATKYLCPADLIPAAFEAFMRGDFGFSKAYIIAKSPDQEATFALSQQGLKRDELQGQTKKRRTGTSAVRAGKLKIQLSNGTTLAMSGREFDMGDVVEDLQAILKDAKKAMDSAWDVKTWAAVMRDRAAAG